MIYAKDNDGVLELPPQEISQNVELLLGLNYIGFDETDFAQYKPDNTGAKIFKNGALVDNDLPIFIELQKNIKRLSLQAQIDEIDFKRIRAISEPQIKDKTTGQTWLEFYTLQIQDLRQQIAGL